MKTNLLMKRLLLLWVFAFSTTLWGQTEIFKYNGGGPMPTDWSAQNNVTPNPIDQNTYWLLDAGATSDVIITNLNDLSSYTSAQFKVDITSFGSGNHNSLKVQIAYDGVNYTETKTTTITTGSYVNQTVALGAVSSQVRIKLSVNATNGRGIRMQNLTLNGIGSVSPKISSSANSLTSFTYIEGNGPSANQSFKVSGSNLTANITVKPPVGYEVSTNPTSGFVDSDSSLNLTQSAGNVAETTIYARLSKDLVINTYAGNITLTSTGATTVNVGVSGLVTAPITATSNNSSYGTVSLSGNVITATPAVGYTFSSPAYTVVPNGSATVSQIGNQFTVNATASTSIQINFEAKPNFTLSLMNDGSSCADSNFPFTTYEGNTIVLPTLTNCGDFAFIGWDTNGSTVSAPTYFGGAIYSTTASNVTLYAVYSKVVGIPVTWSKVTALNDIVPGKYVIVNGAYFLPNTNTTSANPPGQVTLASKAVTASGTKLDGSISGDMQWDFTGSNSAMSIKSAANSADILYNISNNNGVRINTTSANWVFEKYSTGFAMSTNSRYCAVYSAGSDWRSYTTRDASNYGENAGILDIYKKAGGSTTVYTTAPNCPTTWSGSIWSNGIPDADKEAIIDGAYSINTPIIAKNLIINLGKTLTVKDYVSVSKVTNNGNIIVDDNANFVQTDTFTPVGSSTFTVNRTTRDVSRLDYIAWSSPMDNSSQTLVNFSPLTANTRYLTYNNGLFVKVDNPNVPFNVGQGYLIRTPNNFPTFPATQKFNGVFTGVKPNTGSLTYNPSVIDGEFVFLGNPYPSAISMEAFHEANPQIDGSFYIWDSVLAKMDVDGKYSGPNYVTYSEVGSVPGGETESFVPVGQGFFINRGASNALLNFNDGMRQTSETGTFAKASVTDKFWLQMTAPSGAKPQMLIGFAQNATSGFDKGLDAKMLDSNADVIYSTVDDKSLIINALGSFTTADVINVTANFLTTGNYTIGLANKKGIFANGQQIYLKDNLTGTETELTSGDYAFAATAGIQANRFTVFFSKSVLASSNATKGQSTIYASNQIVHVKGASKIASVEVYDMSGKLMKTTKNVNSESTSLAVAYKGVAVVKLVLENGEVVTKKVILK